MLGNAFSASVRLLTITPVMGCVLGKFRILANSMFDLVAFLAIDSMSFSFLSCQMSVRCSDVVYCHLIDGSR